MNFASKFRVLKTRKSFKYGLPFMIMIVGGAFGLKHFTSLRYQFRRSKLLSQEALKEHGIEKKPLATLDEEYEKMQNVDIDNWENIRGPRPWEDSEYKNKIKERQSTLRKRSEEHIY